MRSFCNQNPIKIFQKSIPSFIVFSIHFHVHFCSKKVPATTLCWPFLGLLRTAPFLQEGSFVGLIFFWCFWALLGPFWSLLGLSGLDFGGFGRSFSKFLVFIFFTISKLFKPNIDFGFDFGTTCLHNRLCHENPRIDLSYLLQTRT